MSALFFTFKLRKIMYTCMQYMIAFNILKLDKFTCCHYKEIKTQMFADGISYFAFFHVLLS
jgi:hypothetical protein